MIVSLRRFLKYIWNWNRVHNLVKYPISSEVSLSSEFEGANRIGEHCVFNGKMGYGTYMGDSNNLTAMIGRFTSIGHNCSILTGRHPYSYPYVSTSPMFFSLKKQTGESFATEQLYQDEHAFADATNKYKVAIGNDCWIQSEIRIVAGVKISDGAVVLSGAVVTKDVPPYAIVGGIPAKIVGYRYKEEDIDFLIKSAWWNKDLDWIRKNWRALNNFEEYKLIVSNEQ